MPCGRPAPGTGQAAPGRGSPSAGGRPGGELADPAHPLGGRLGVVAELLCHPARAAAGAEPAHGAADRLGHTFGGRCVPPLQLGGGQGLAPVRRPRSTGASPHPRPRYGSPVTERARALSRAAPACLPGGDRWRPPPGAPPALLVHDTCGTIPVPVRTGPPCPTGVTAANTHGQPGPGSNQPAV